MLIENQDSKKIDTLPILILSLLTISVVVGIAVYNAGPFIADYLGALLGLIISLMILFFIGIDTIKNLKDKNKKMERKLWQYIGGITAIIIGSFMIITFSTNMIKAIYNTVEYSKGNVVNNEFKINSVQLGYGRGVEWIRSAQATKVSTGESIGFECNLEVGSLLKGKIYYIEYIPFTNRITYFKR